MQKSSIQQKANSGLISTTNIKQKNKNKNKKRKNKQKGFSKMATSNKISGISSLSMSASLTKFNQAIQSSYQRALIAPEFVRDAKIPALFPLPTVSTHMKTTIKFTTNSSGNAAILINPWYLCDTSNAYSWILINNDVNLDLITNSSMTTSFVAKSMQSRITANTASAYRLVSASLHIYPEMSINTAQGYIAGGIVTRTAQVDSYVTNNTGYNPFGGNACVASVIDQALYYQKSQIGGQAGVRCIYMPFDPTFEMFVTIGQGRAGAMTTGIDNFFWNYYVTGTQASANMVCEIYYNFELEPLQEGILELMTTQHVSDRSENTLTLVAKNPELISQSSSNLLGVATAIDDCVLSGKKTISFLDKTIDWISNHSGDVLNILSTVGRLF